MRFALVDHERKTPSPGLSGFCPSCGSPMIAKCGSWRVWHWAHCSQRVCDGWWEPETPWHRNWKDRFPTHWQEVIQHDAKGERHIADVHTAHGVTLEFQHSHLRPDERAAREAFHRNMVWIVDGGRLKSDLRRLLQGRTLFTQTAFRGLFITAAPEAAFPRDWLDCKAPVLFDFREADIPDPDRPFCERLWCLLPGQVFGHVVVLRMSREVFIRLVHERAEPIPIQVILARVASWLMELASQAEVLRPRIVVEPGRRRRGRRWSNTPKPYKNSKAFQTKKPKRW